MPRIGFSGGLLLKSALFLGNLAKIVVFRLRSWLLKND